MPVFRVEKNKDYTTISNYHLRDKRLSLKAKGLLSIMLSLPDDWDYSLEGLVSICLEKETSIKSSLKELKKNNYLYVRKYQNKKGKFEYEYNIYENPIEPDIDCPAVDIPAVEVPGVDYPAVENQGQLNTNNKILNNKILNNNKKEIIKEKKEKRYFENDNLNDLFKDFLSMRKKIKAVNSDRAITLLMNKLSKYDDKTKIKMIENSIENSWKGIYELKEDNKQTFKHYKSKYEKEEEAMRRFLEADDD